MTGDDTEDHDILQKAQIGIGLETCSNEVVKSAANIILLNNSFNSIIPAILFGRNIYEFVRKYFQLIISSNIVMITILFINMLSDKFAPFTSA